MKNMEAIYYQTHPGHFTGKKHTDETKHKISEHNKTLIGEKNVQFGTSWITKDGLNKKCKKDEINQFISLGWVKGKIQKKKISLVEN